MEEKKLKINIPEGYEIECFNISYRRNKTK